MMIKHGLTEREWKRIATVLPPSGGVGRPRRGDREALAILFVPRPCREPGL